MEAKRTAVKALEVKKPAPIPNESTKETTKVEFAN
jgi:hypothetical protein